MRRREIVRDKRWLTLAFALVSTSACIDSSRVNSTCAWSDPVSTQLDLSKALDREHLRQDAQLALEVAIQHGDERYRVASVQNSPVRHACHAALKDSIVARHGVSNADMHDAVMRRVWWVDILAVFLPMIVLAIVVTRFVARFVGDVRSPIPRALLLAMPTALIMAGFAQYWGMGVETLRLRNWHLSERIVTLPLHNHSITAVGVIFLVCLLAVPRASASRSG